MEGLHVNHRLGAVPHSCHLSSVKREPWFPDAVPETTCEKQSICTITCCLGLMPNGQEETICHVSVHHQQKETSLPGLKRSAAETSLLLLIIQSCVVLTPDDVSLVNEVGCLQAVTQLHQITHP